MNSKELLKVRTAAKLVSFLAKGVVSFIKPGLRECDVASFIRKRIRFYGGDGEAFRSIVAAGKRSSMPHGYATKNRIRYSDIVMVDCGVRYKGYCSDITRMVFLNNAGAGFQPCRTTDPRISKIYNIVKSAQRKALRLVRSGMPVRNIDRAVRKEFQKYGLERYFPHSTGRI